MVLWGVSSSASGVGHDFLSVPHGWCQMMLSRNDNNFELGNLMNELEDNNLQTLEKGVKKVLEVFSGGHSDA